jgi:hypothetical protein
MLQVKCSVLELLLDMSRLDVGEHWAHLLVVHDQDEFTVIVPCKMDFLLINHISSLGHDCNHRPTARLRNGNGWVGSYLQESWTR